MLAAVPARPVPWSAPAPARGAQCSSS